MSAFIFFQEAAQLVLPTWIGWTGAGVISVGAFTIHRMISSQFSKKVDKETFTEYKEGHDKIHDEYRDDIREIKKGILILTKEKKDKN